MKTPARKSKSYLLSAASTTNYRRATSTIPKDEVHVTSLGSGPVTDPLSLLAAIDEIFESRPSSFIFHLFDGAVEWQTTIRTLLEIDPSLRIEPALGRLDLQRTMLPPNVEVVDTEEDDNRRLV